ncbi:hypothetical protein EDC04DRAFT_2023347 [Pisolithus marmoratus]|nr:hypothetical protein EDC04DRAFT_2023347 [Pisolithus marmoratus]
MLLFRNPVSREIVIGTEKRVEQCVHATVLTRIAEEISDDLIGGQKVFEVRPKPVFSFPPNPIPASSANRWPADPHGRIYNLPVSYMRCVRHPLLHLLVIGYRIPLRTVRPYVANA